MYDKNIIQLNQCSPKKGFLMNKFIMMYTIGCLLLIKSMSANISPEQSMLLNFVEKHSSQITNHMFRSINHPTQKTLHFNQNKLRNPLRKNVNKNIKKQLLTAEEMAFFSVKESAESGYVPAQDMLAYCYASGTGTKVNTRLAFCWYLQAAFGGSSSAKDSLIACFNEGIGVARDPKISAILESIFHKK